MINDGEPKVLIPYHRLEALTVVEAIEIARVKARTMREWCARLNIGRRIGGRWLVSKVALAMHLDGDRVALAAYLAGDRTSQSVTQYFRRLDVPLPKQPISRAA